LDENKDQGLSSNRENPNDEGAAQASEKARDTVSDYDKKDDYSEDELENELEHLSELFKTELDKATEEFENEPDEIEIDEEVKELDDIKEQLEKEVIPEDMLCRCCGERERDISHGQDYEYCSHCREGMRHYPMGIQYLLLAFLTVFLAGVSVFLFLKNFDALYRIREAEVFLSESKMTSAAKKYKDADFVFSEKSLNAKRLKLKAVETSFNSISSFGALNTLSTQLDAILSPIEFKLFWNSRYYNLRNELLTITATLNAYSEIVSKYKEEETLPYDTIVSLLEELIGKTTEIAAPKSPKVSLINSGENKTITVEYNKAFIRFCQYLMLLQKGEKDDLTTYLEEIRELTPAYVWLYGYELGMDYVQNGNFDEAENIRDLLLKYNREDQYAYILKAVIFRLQKNYDAAVKSCDEGIELCGDVSELYRQKAICCIITKKYDQALDIMKDLNDETKHQSIYIETIFTLAIAADLAGDEKALEGAEDMIEFYKIEYSEKLKSYFKGELSAEQLFTTGTCDVID